MHNNWKFWRAAPDPKVLYLVVLCVSMSQIHIYERVHQLKKKMQAERLEVLEHIAWQKSSFAIVVSLHVPRYMVTMCHCALQLINLYDEVVKKLHDDHS